MTLIVITEAKEMYADSYQGGGGFNGFPVRKIKRLVLDGTNFWAAGAGSVSEMELTYTQLEEQGLKAYRQLKETSTEVLLLEIGGEERVYYLQGHEGGRFVLARGMHLPHTVAAVGTVSYYAAYLAEHDDVEKALTLCCKLAAHVAFPLFYAASDGLFKVKVSENEPWRTLEPGNPGDFPEDWHHDFFDRDYGYLEE